MKNNTKIQTKLEAVEIDKNIYTHLKERPHLERM